jgi:hypothetical protein
VANATNIATNFLIDNPIFPALISTCYSICLEIRLNYENSRLFLVSQVFGSKPKKEISKMPNRMGMRYSTYDKNDPTLNPEVITIHSDRKDLLSEEEYEKIRKLVFNLDYLNNPLKIVINVMMLKASMLTVFVSSQDYELSIRTFLLNKL